MGIKGLDLQEPVIVSMVLMNEFKTALEGRILRCLFFRIHVSAVALIHTQPVLVIRYIIQQPVGLVEQCPAVKLHIQICLPGITLLTSAGIPCRIPRMICTSAVFPVVLVVTDQMGMYACLLQDLRHRIIIRFDRSPAPVQEIRSAGMQFTSCGHAGHTAYITLIKLNAVLCQTLKIGRFRPVTSVRLQHISDQGVVHHHDSFHIISPLLKL